MEISEEKLIEDIKPHILRCRAGDWEHAKRVVKWVKELGEGRTDLFLLITAGYIHDIGWRDLVSKDKITFDELLELEPQANKNSEPNIREILKELDYSESDIETILRLVSAADEHKSSSEDEAIIVDADQLSKLDINHLKEKFQKSEWMKMYELWNKEFDNRITTEKARQIYPDLLLKLKELIAEEYK
jgi:HD superfamily phosphodiesterase